MRVRSDDAVCSQCGGEFEIVDADDATMTVECVDCGDLLVLEPDALGDGCIDYYIPFLADRATLADEGAD